MELRLWRPSLYSENLCRNDHSRSGLQLPVCAKNTTTEITIQFPTSTIFYELIMETDSGNSKAPPASMLEKKKEEQEEEEEGEKKNILYDAE